MHGYGHQSMLTAAAWHSKLQDHAGEEHLIYILALFYDPLTQHASGLILERLANQLLAEENASQKDGYLPLIQSAQLL